MAGYDIVERPERDQLGEAAFWCGEEEALYWVDIVGKRAHRLDPSSGAIQSWSTPSYVSAAIPTERGDLLAPMADGVYRLDRDSGRVAPFADPEHDPHNRSNETRTDPQGRLWFGTMCNNIGPHGEPVRIDRDSGAIYCIDGEGRSTTLLTGIGITNSFAWSPDGARYYTADTPKGVIWSFAYDPDGPALHDRHVFAQGFPGGPDGAAMDEEGRLWSCRWGAGRVTAFTPDGRIDQEIELPVSQPSCCTFGGTDRRTLYITTARQGLDGLKPDSLDGAVFIVRVDTPGLALRRFRG